MKKNEEKHRNELQKKDDTIQALRHEIAELCNKISPDRGTPSGAKPKKC